MNKIKVIRAKNDMTQDKLANLCNLSRATINSIENNKSTPRKSTKAKIAGVFHCSINDLFEGGENDAKQTCDTTADN